MDKVTFTGKIISVQPRIRLIRSFDEISHNYLGYALFLNGTIGEDDNSLLVLVKLPMPSISLESVMRYLGLRLLLMSGWNWWSFTRCPS